MIAIINMWNSSIKSDEFWHRYDTDDLISIDHQVVMVYKQQNNFSQINFQVICTVEAQSAESSVHTLKSCIRYVDFMLL